MITWNFNIWPGVVVSLVASPEKLFKIGKNILTVTHKSWYLLWLPPLVLGERSFNYRPKNRCQIPQLSCCHLLFVMSHPGAHPSRNQFSWEASMCGQKLVLMDGLMWGHLEGRSSGIFWLQFSLFLWSLCSCSPHSSPITFILPSQAGFYNKCVSSFSSCSTGSSNTPLLNMSIHIVSATHEWQEF